MAGGVLTFNLETEAAALKLIERLRIFSCTGLLFDLLNDSLIQSPDSLPCLPSTF